MFSLPVNSIFQKSHRRQKPIGVRSTCYFTAAIMHFENCELGDYLPIAGEYFKDSLTLDSSNNRPKKATETFGLKASTLVSDITIKLLEAKYVF